MVFFYTFSPELAIPSLPCVINLQWFICWIHWLNGAKQTTCVALNQIFLEVVKIIFFSVYQVVEGIKPTLLELQKFETAPEDVELEGNG